MKIGIDVDGVVGNFFKPYEDLIVRMTNRDLFPKRWPYALPPCWDWPQHYGYLPEEIKQVWAYIKSHPLWWMEEPELPGMESVREIDTGLHDLYFITNRPGAGVQLVTNQWLTEHGIIGPNVIVTGEHKGEIVRSLGLDVMIDDKPENIYELERVSPTTRTYMVEYPYNSHVDALRPVRSVADALREEGLL